MIHMLNLGVRWDILTKVLRQISKKQYNLIQKSGISNAASTNKVQVLERSSIILKLAPLYYEWN